MRIKWLVAPAATMLSVIALAMTAFAQTGPTPGAGSSLSGAVTFSSVTISSGGSIVPGGTSFALGSANTTVTSTGIIESITSAAFAQSFIFRSSNGFLQSWASGQLCWSTAGAGGVSIASPGTCDTGVVRASAGQVNITDGTATQVGTFVIASGVISNGVQFSSLGSSVPSGTMIYCINCDAPTLVDSTCTSAGAKTGSLAVRTNGVWKCIS